MTAAPAVRGWTTVFYDIKARGRGSKISEFELQWKITKCAKWRGKIIIYQKKNVEQTEKWWIKYNAKGVK